MMNVEISMRSFVVGVVMTGCNLTSSNVTPYIELPPPPEIKMRDVQWQVFVKDEKGADGNIGASTYMCLDPHSYSNMALNLQDLKLFMIYQNKVIEIKGK